MRFMLSFLLIAVLSYVAGLFLPWWSIAVVSFCVILFLPMAPWKSFLSGFLGVGLLWFLLAFVIDQQNLHILASRMSILFFGKPNPLFFSLLTACTGALVGGFAALSAGCLYLPQRKRKAVISYNVYLSRKFK